MRRLAQKLKGMIMFNEYNTHQLIYFGLFMMWIAIGMLTLSADNSPSKLQYGLILITLLLCHLDNIVRG